MVDETQVDGEGGSGIPAVTERALAALLAIDAAAAQRVREGSPTRRRSRPRHGPQLDLGHAASDPGPD